MVMPKFSTSILRYSRLGFGEAVRYAELIRDLDGLKYLASRNKKILCAWQL